MPGSKNICHTCCFKTQEPHLIDLIINLAAEPGVFCDSHSLDSGEGNPGPNQMQVLARHLCLPSSYLLVDLGAVFLFILLLSSHSSSDTLSGNTGRAIVTDKCT